MTGKTTIQKLLDQEIIKEKYEEISGFKIPEKETITVKDFINEKGLEFKEIKDKFGKILKNK